MTKAKGLNAALNIAALVCAVFVIWQFADRYYFSASRRGNTVVAGSKVELPGINWAASPKTVVLALSAYCQHCRSSAPFYRSLAGAAKGGQFRTVAVLREPPAQSASLLPDLGVDGVQEVRHVDLETIGVRAAPTVLIVDDKGSVQAAWTGKLNESQEKDVFAKLAVAAPPRRPPAATVADVSGLDIVGASELRELLKNRETLLLIDTRDRDIFEQSHIVGALNIPLDEILSRAPHELPKDKTIHVYCHFSRTCQDGRAAGGEQPQLSLCAVSSVGFGWAAFHKLKYIPDGLPVLAAQGIPIAGTHCK
jgi:hypothetical protein